MSDQATAATVAVAAPAPRAAVVPWRGRLGSQIAAVAFANAAVAGLGFLGSGVLLPHALDLAAFTAVSLFLAAFQFLQEAFGRSLNWAVVRLCPVAEAEQPGGGARMLDAARSLQRRLAVAGCAAVALVAPLVSRWLDGPGAPSRGWLLLLAAIGAAVAVQFQFGLGVLQLRHQFLRMAGLIAAQSGLRVAAWALLFAVGALGLTTAIVAHLGTSLALVLLLRGRQRSTAVPPRVHDPARLAADRRRVLRFGGSMAVATTLAATAAQIDLFLLDGRGEDAATARLRIAVLFATVIELATSAVMTALLPRAGSAHDAVAQRLTLRRGLGWGGAIALVAVVTLPLVQFGLPLVLPQYAAAAALYPVLLVGVVATALTDPLGLLFVSRDRPGRFVVLNALMLTVVVGGNLWAPGADRALVAAQVRTAARLVLATGILTLLFCDRARAQRARTIS